MLERADYIAGRKKIDSRRVAERRSTDQSRNGCRMCPFCHAQLFELTHAENIKSPLEQPSCQNAKVVEAFCDAGCRLSTPYRPLVCQPPVDALRVPADMPTAPLGSPAGRHPRCLRLVSSLPSKAAQHAILIEFCCRLVKHFPRLGALALLSRRPPHRVVRPSFRRPKTCT